MEKIPDREHFHYLDQVNIKRGDTPVTIHVDEAQCVGCGICVVNSKGSMVVIMDKAKIIAEKASTWNILPGFEKCCPLGAIVVVDNYEDKT
jgi:ferredoxin